MSATMIAILLGLWLIGVVTSYTFGGFLHLLFLLALIVFAISIIRDRRVAAFPEIASEIHLNTVDVINNWISERRENNRLDKVFSAARILAWRSPHPQI